MEEFIRRENIKHYRCLLESVTDEGERARILQMIVAEEQKEREALKAKTAATKK